MNPAQTPVASEAAMMVAMVQLTEPMLALTNLPYAAGLLQAYVQHAAPGRYLFLLPLFERLNLDDAVAQLALADCVGFSVYVWNIEYSLALAKRLKEHKPEILIVFGGPQVPDQATEFMQANPFIDLCIHGEGELAFLELLKRFDQKQDFNGIAGLSQRTVQGEILTSPRGPRLMLDQMPSPYLTGVFEPLMLSRPDMDWVAIWETNRGCPYACTFCDWGSVTASKVRDIAFERVQAEIHWFAKHRIKAVFCADANFGLRPRDLEIAEALAESKQQTGFPLTVYTQTAKNVTERIYQVHKRLSDAGLSPVATLSLQTLNRDALTAIKRDNISLKTYAELQRRFRREGAAAYTDYLVGLPGETLESFCEGIGRVIAEGQHQELRCWCTFILPNAELNQPAYRLKHGIQSVKIPMYTWMQPVQTSAHCIIEYQEMLVTTNTYSREDWIQMRAFAWLTQLLYYSRALQPAMMLLHEFSGLAYHQLLLVFMSPDLPNKYSVLIQLRDFLLGHAREMANGGPEYMPCEDPASGRKVWVGADYFAAILLLYSNRLEAFFSQSLELLSTLERQSNLPLPPGLLKEALSLGRALFYSQRSEGQTFNLTLSWNLWEVYQQILRGDEIALRRESGELQCRRAQIVWRGRLSNQTVSST